MTQQVAHTAINHMPWDNGAVDDAFDAVLGFHMPQKTTKTRCGKRVSMAVANHKSEVTCDACLADIAAQELFAKKLTQELAKYGL